MSGLVGNVDHAAGVVVPAVRELRGLEFHPDVTFIIGENGCGKSTLLEAIAAAWGFNPEGGTVNFRFSTRASHSELHTHLRLVKSTRRPKDGFFLRAESFFNVATDIERMDAEPTLGSPVISPRTWLASGVLSTPRGWWQRVGGLFTGRYRRQTGYAVNALEAVNLLAAKDPGAAAWWREHCAFFLDGKRHFVFAAEACEERP